MRDPKFIIEIIEVSCGTFGIGLMVFGFYRGIQSPEKLIFVPVGLALAGFVLWKQKKRGK